MIGTILGAREIVNKMSKSLCPCGNYIFLGVTSLCISFPGATVIYYHKLRGLKQNYYLTVLEARSVLKARCWQGCTPSGAKSVFFFQFLVAASTLGLVAASLQSLPLSP